MNKFDLDELIKLLSQGDLVPPRSTWKEIANADWDCPYFGRTLIYDPITKTATLSKRL